MSDTTEQTGKLECTGERYSPEMHGEIEIEHVHRYAVALPLARGKRVLDIACGEGYGSSILSQVAAQVIGVESMACSNCGARFRGRQTARALVQLYGGRRCFSLHQLLDQHSFRSLRVLVMADTTIDALKPHPHCQFSDYYLSLIPATGHEDNGLEAADASLDLVITSDIIEHTPYYVRAMEEFRRALKPGGIWLAILPLMPERLTRTRAVVDGDGNVRHLMEESHHVRGQNDSLVFVEFGSDFVRTMEGVGFQVRIFYFSLFEFDYTSVSSPPSTSLRKRPDTDLSAPGPGGFKPNRDSPARDTNRL